MILTINWKKWVFGKPKADDLQLEEMERALEKERKERMMETLPETIRVILSEYLRKNT